MKIKLLALSLLSLMFAASCGHKKVEGPLPEAGDLNLKILYLVDPNLPVLPEQDLRRALDISEKQISEQISRKVRFEITGNGDLQKEFSNLIAPFHNPTFEPRLDLTRPLSEEHKRIFYARIMELMRNNKLRPILPAFSLPRDFSDVSIMLDTVARQFEDRVVELGRSPLFSAGSAKIDLAVQNRRSVFAWYTALGGVPPDSKPADVILTNDVLIFDGLSTIPPQSIAGGGVAVAYTRVYPGISVISTLPFLSNDPGFSELVGTAEPARRLRILAWAISREVGGKLIRMEQEEIDHPVSCLNEVLLPPFDKSLSEIETPAHCAREHRPLNRIQLLTDYLVGLAQISLLNGQPQAAEGALIRLKEISPKHPAAKFIEDSLKTEYSKKS